MSTMNLSPKNPMVLFAALGFAYFVWSSSKANAQKTTTAGTNFISPLPTRNPPKNLTVAQQAKMAASNEANYAGAVGGIIQYLMNRKPSAVTPEARAVVREGDGYYYGNDRGALNGSPPGYSMDNEAAAAAADEFYYGSGGSGQDATVASPIVGIEYDAYDLQ